MSNLFSRSEIYELKRMIKIQRNNCINNTELDEDEKIEYLNNFNKVLLNMEKDMNSKRIKILK